jgi:CheY-like chemotaxis protein
MLLVCTGCSAKLSIPDAKVPKSGAFTVSCPKCQQKIQVSAKRPDTDTPEAGTPSSQIDNVITASAEEPLLETRRRAMVCVDQLHGQLRIKTALAELGYTVHIVNDPHEAVDRMWQRPYDLVILHEEYGGSADNSLLKTIQPMPMSNRRQMCVGLIGRQYRTLDQMAAFVQSVNFVVAEQEINNLKAIVLEAVADNDRFYRVFREALREAGRL